MKSGRRKLPLWAGCLLALLAAWFFFARTVPPGGKAVAPVGAGGFSDDFSTAAPRWNWGETAGGGFHVIPGPGRNGIAGIGLRPAGGGAESDCSLEERAALHGAGSLSLRLRVPGTAEGFSGGTLGFGLWSNEGGRIDAAWFLLCSKAGDPQLAGFAAVTVTGSRLSFRRPLAVDLARWHTYEIRVGGSGVLFRVDGRDAARAPLGAAAFSRKKIVAWIDNKAISLTPGGYRVRLVPVSRAVSMDLDFIRFSAEK